MRGNESGSRRGPAITIMRNPGTRRLASGNASMARRSSPAPTADPPAATMQIRSSGWKPNSARRASRSAISAGSKPVT